MIATRERGEHRVVSLDVDGMPTVSRFIRSQAYLRILRGPRGEGKTTSVLIDLLCQAERLPRDVWPLRAICVRDSWTTLQRSTMENLRELEAKGVPVRWQQRDTEALIAGRVHLFFVGMDNPHDLNKFQGFKAAVLWIEEPAPVLDISAGLPFEVFSVGGTSLRQEGIPSRVIISMNPPDEDHWSMQLIQRAPAVRKQLPNAKWDLEVFDIPPGENPHISLGKREQWHADLLVGGRADLIGRLIHGKVGYVEPGVAVMPEYSDAAHLAKDELDFLDGMPIVRGWDFGLNPTCVWTQKTPSGFFHVVGALVGENIGLEQFLEFYVKPWEKEHIGDPDRFEFRDIYDPAGEQREQSNSERSAFRVLSEHYPDSFFEPGPVEWDERKDALKGLLSSLIRGRGRVQICPVKAKPVFKALRPNGMHYPKDKNGHVTSTVQAAKRASGIASHPFDALCYVAARLFPGPQMLPRRPRPAPPERKPGSRLAWMRA